MAVEGAHTNATLVAPATSKISAMRWNAATYSALSSSAVPVVRQISLFRKLASQNQRSRTGRPYALSWLANWKMRASEAPDTSRSFVSPQRHDTIGIAPCESAIWVRLLFSTHPAAHG